MARSRVPLLLATFAAASVAFAVACSDIVGLSDFERGECPGAICTGGPDFDAGLDTGAVDAGPDVTADTGGGAEPVTWARWPIPEHDGGSVPASYEQGAGEIQDKVTKLVWKSPMGADARELTLEEAREHCARARARASGGPWRLPKRIELVTLLYPERPGRRIDPLFADDTLEGAYWTSSEVRPLGTGARQYWVVGFVTGLVEKRNATERAAVRCVKGAEQ
jgi:hypothetical protein